MGLLDQILGDALGARSARGAQGNVAQLVLPTR